MTKYEELKKKYKEVQARIAELQENIPKKEEERDTNAQLAEAAASAGDEKEYLYLKSCISTIEASIYVMKAELKQLTEGNLLKSSAGLAWDEYYTPVDKELDKCLKDYYTKRRELSKAYDEIMEMLRGAYAMRQDLLKYSEPGYSEMTMRDAIALCREEYPVREFSVTDETIEKTYFLEAGEIDEYKARLWDSLVADKATNLQGFPW